MKFKINIKWLKQISIYIYQCGLEGKDGTKSILSILVGKIIQTTQEGNVILARFVSTFS